MISLSTPADRTLYFDFLPMRIPSVDDIQLRLQLFTMPGQIYFNATRKLMLTGTGSKLSGETWVDLIYSGTGLTTKAGLARHG